jgi:Flp pilus assembly protein TadG
MSRPRAIARVLWRGFARDCAGNVAIVLSLAAPVIMFAMGAGVDYARGVGARASLQSAADGAALAGVQSLRLANSSAQTSSQVVASFIHARVPATAPAITIASQVTNANTTVAVQLEQNIPTLLSKFFGVATMHVSVKAQARLAGGGGMPICMIALDPSSSGAASVDQATLTAPGCLIFSDSSAVDALTVSNGAAVTSGRTCSHGGVRSDVGAVISPAAQTDCPALADPLASRTQPPVGACSQTGLKITNGSTSLTPGVYCAGLEISGNANVTLLAGTYVIKDGPFVLKAGATVSGADVTIFLTGTGATLAVENKSTVSLTAPSAGAMAGMLIFEDRGAPLGQIHKFESRNAPNMLGTIYLRQGNIQIGVKGGGGGAGVGVGATSAWTIIVARQIAVEDQQTLVLNVNYNATTVPPPSGFLPGTGAAQLSE